MFQEVIDYDNSSENRARNYTANGLVTEFRYSKSLGEVFRSLNRQKLAYLRNFGEGWGFLPGKDAVVFVDNHDEQRGHGRDYVVTHKNGITYELANVFMLTWPYGYPKVMSSYAFENFDEGPPSARVHNKDDTMNCSLELWRCEHRWGYIRGAVAFRNNTTDNWKVTNWW